MKNVGKTDSLVRYGLAAVLVVIGVMNGAGSTLSLVLYALAAVLVVTAAVRFCPIWKVLGIKTTSR